MNGVSADADGSFFLAGSTEGSFNGQKENDGFSDMVVAKIDSDGVLLWSWQVLEVSYCKPIRERNIMAPRLAYTGGMFNSAPQHFSTPRPNPVCMALSTIVGSAGHPLPDWTCGFYGGRVAPKGGGDIRAIHDVLGEVPLCVASVFGRRS